MKARRWMAGLFGSLVVIGAARADCRVTGRFDMRYDGPWILGMTTNVGQPCGPSFESRGALFKRLNALELPTNGRIELRQGGHYLYTPNPGFRGKDSFVFQICGETSGNERCVEVRYQVTVE